MFTWATADDDAVVGLITNTDETFYRREISNFSKWCSDNFLILNTKKTKEMVIDFRHKKQELTPVNIDNCDIETVNEYKYLGTVIDDKLNWNSNTDKVYTKCQQRLFLLRRLRSF